MLVSEDYFIKNIAKQWFATNNMVALKITNQCPVACSHCRENASMENKGVITKEVIDKVFEQIVAGGDAENWIICLQGGEAILYPELCEYVINKCKENNIASNMYSSGWWWKECDKYIPMILRWNPTIVAISVNDWLVEKFGGLEYVNTIAKYFSDDNTPILLYSEVNLDGAKWGKQCKYQTCSISYELAPVGRAFKLIGTYEKAGKQERWMNNSICSQSGYEIGIDGTVWPNCCAASAGACKFGNILTGTNISELRKKSRQNRCRIDPTRSVQKQKNPFLLF